MEELVILQVFQILSAERFDPNQLLETERDKSLELLQRAETKPWELHRFRVMSVDTKPDPWVGSSNGPLSPLRLYGRSLYKGDKGLLSEVLQPQGGESKKVTPYCPTFVFLIPGSCLRGVNAPLQSRKTLSALFQLVSFL